VTRCYECKTPFSVSLWKHHCRSCGRVFCYACSSKTTVIPFYITKVPVPNEKHKNEDRTKPVRVCDPCYDRLKNLEHIANHVDGSKGRSADDDATTSLELTELQRLADPQQTTDSLLRQWANFKLSTLREIQYALPGHAFSGEEKEMLWVNRHHFLGHNIWFGQLLRSIDFMVASSAVLSEVDRLLSEFKRSNQTVASNVVIGHRHTSCWNLMCSRYCDTHFSVKDAIQLLNQQLCYNPVRAFALSFMEHCSDQELKLWVPYLVRHSLYAPIVHQWLISRCSKSELIANEVFWEFQNYLNFCRPQIIRLSTSTTSSGGDVRLTDDARSRAGSGAGSAGSSHLFEVIQEALAEWKRAISAEVQAKILSGAEFVQAIRAAYKGPNGPEGVAHAFAALQKNAYYLPTDISQCARVDYQNVVVMGSCTAPVMLPMRPVEASLSSSFTTVTPAPQLYKPSDIRKEQIIMNTVRLMKWVLLQDEGLNLPIVEYDIRPTSERDGLIQMVPNCVSLEELRATRTDIRPWIIDQNEDSTETASELRDRFLQSCAAYCVISYLLGIGDRNLHNLLLRPDGSLFHIDFGFVLGQDPKPLEKPQMRITPEMLAALGGAESQTYKRFRELSSRIYNCIRRHINVFVVMLRLLVEATPVIEENGTISEERLMKEIRRRFAPGENYQEAEILLYNHIEQSTTRTFTYHVIDKCHTWATSSMTPSVVSSIPRPSLHGAYHTANVLLRTLWSVAGFVDKPTKE